MTHHRLADGSIGGGGEHIAAVGSPALDARQDLVALRHGGVGVAQAGFDLTDGVGSETAHAGDDEVKRLELPELVG